MGLKAFVSVDLEGLPHIVSRAQLLSDKQLWAEGRKIATDLTVTVAQALKSEGFDEVVVADSHADMVNILIEDLPEYVSLVRGYPRIKSMITRSEGCNAAFFIGYHAGVGTPYATFDHSFSSGAIKSLEVNGVRMSEYAFNTLALSENGVPLLFVAGDEALRSEVEKLTPWAVFVPLKKSIGRYSSISPSLSAIKKELINAAVEAARRYKKGDWRLISVEKPVRTRVDFLYTSYADVAEYLPLVKRIDGTMIEFSTNSINEAYGILELLILAAMGVKSLTEK